MFNHPKIGNLMILVIINGFCSGQVHLIHKDSWSRALFSNNHSFKKSPFWETSHFIFRGRPHFPLPWLWLEASLINSHSPEKGGFCWVGVQLKIIQNKTMPPAGSASKSLVGSFPGWNIAYHGVREIDHWPWERDKTLYNAYIWNIVYNLLLLSFLREASEKRKQGSR